MTIVKDILCASVYLIEGENLLIRYKWQKFQHRSVARCFQIDPVVFGSNPPSPKVPLKLRTYREEGLSDCSISRKRRSVQKSTSGRYA